MKKIAALIIILAGVFFASQLMAQVDSKTQGTGTTNTSTKKTGDPKVFDPSKSTSSKSKPSTTTTTTQGTSATKQGTTGQSGQGSMTTAKFAKTGQMFDASGNLLYSYDQLGYIRNAKNRVICQLTTKGEIIVKRSKVGTADKGVFRDRFGKEYARIVQEGKIVDANSKSVGAIKDDGAVLDKSGNKIGSAPNVDKNAVVLVFFYQDVLVAKSPKSTKK